MTKNPGKLHSTRSNAGWMIVDLWLGYLVFQGNSAFGQDAERYRQRANEIAQIIWDKRLNETPYQACLTVGYEYIPSGIPEKDVRLNEASMQLGIALYAACLGARLEGTPANRELWLDLVRYHAGCLLQPGVIDWPRGGILARYSTGGPAPDDGRPVGERLEETAPAAYRFRSVLSAEGWIGQSLAMATRLLPKWVELAELSKAVYDNQKVKRVTGGAWFFTPQSWDYWGSAHETVVQWGPYSPDGVSSESAPEPEGDLAQWPDTAPRNAGRTV